MDVGTCDVVHQGHADPVADVAEMENIVRSFVAPFTLSFVGEQVTVTAEEAVVRDVVEALAARGFETNQRLRHSTLHAVSVDSSTRVHDEPIEKEIGRMRASCREGGECGDELCLRSLATWRSFG